MNNSITQDILLEVSMDDQVLDVISNGTRVRRFPISTGEKGMGFVEGSFRTPTGRFRISEKIGNDQPIGTIFVARVPCGVWDSAEISEDDLILTRILRLEGMDAENANTMIRNIYIHGTNREDRIGIPGSHGCLRLTNEDVIELFDLVPLGTELLIHPFTRRSGNLLFIDCDSTLSSIEGIDELARLSDPQKFAEVEQLTNSAMNGEVPLDQVFKLRMEIIRPDRRMADEVSQKYINTILPGVETFINRAKAMGWMPVILSGGFEPLIRPLAKRLGIKHVEAVPLFFNGSGEYAGYGEKYPTTRNLGKNEIIREWKAAMLPERVMMIGDGVSDLETKEDVDVMIGFGGVAVREKVKKGADVWIETFENVDMMTSLLA